MDAEQKAREVVPCGCLAKVNKLLRKKGVELDLALNLTGGWGMPRIAVVKVGTAKPADLLVLPNFCPFCGQEYQAKETP